MSEQIKYSLASCQNESCKSKDTCKRYNIDSAVINFKYYSDEDNTKCTYYIKKDDIVCSN